MWSRCRWVRRMLTRAAPRRQRQAEAADARAGVEHHDRAVGERDLHARGVAAVARGLRAGRGTEPRAPQTLTFTRSAPRSVGPEERDRAPRVPPVVTIGIALTSISCSPPSSELDAEAVVGRPALAQRHGERQLLEGDRLAAVVERAEARCPTPPGASCPTSSKRRPSRAPGGLVVEHDHAVLVHEEGRRREARHQVAGEDQLDRLLGPLHAKSVYARGVRAWQKGGGPSMAPPPSWPPVAGRGAATTSPSTTRTYQRHSCPSCPCRTWW